VKARVDSAPGGISGTLRIGERDGASEFVLDGSVKVDIPLVGGKIEEAIAEQVVRLLGREGRFTAKWLAR
jgi:hypothetical protein